MAKLLFSLMGIGMVILTTMLWLVMFALLVAENTFDNECMFMALTAIMSTAVTTWTFQHVRSLDG